MVEFLWEGGGLVMTAHCLLRTSLSSDERVIGAAEGRQRIPDPQEDVGTNGPMRWSDSDSVSDSVIANRRKPSGYMWWLGRGENEGREENRDARPREKAKTQTTVPNVKIWVKSKLCYTECEPIVY